MKRLIVGIAALSAATAVLITSAGVGAAATPKSWMLLANGTLPSGLAAKVQAAGGTITSTSPDIGLAFATSTDANFTSKAEKISGISSVSTNLRTNWLDPEFNYPPTSGDDDIRFDLQWGHIAVDSVGAWNAGYRGNGALIADLDTGFNLTHTDLAPNIVGSASMVDAIPGAQWTGAPTDFSHGTHTAGIAAAPDNGIGTIGIAPEAKLLLVRVLDDSPGGSGTFEDVIEGIVYAADQDADIINMSLGGDRSRDREGRDCRANTRRRHCRREPEKARRAALPRRVPAGDSTGRVRRGSATVDQLGRTSNLMWLRTPAAAHVLSISPAALARQGDVADPTNVGWRLRHLRLLELGKSVRVRRPERTSRPGNEGARAVPGHARASRLRGTRTGRACRRQPGNFFTSPARAWPHRTSRAPRRSSSARTGGSMPPAQVEAALKQSADDLGKPGNDMRSLLRDDDWDG